MSECGEKHSTIDSTQERLKQLLKENAELPDLYYVLADIQTKGRGRSDHTWDSVIGNLHISILLKSPLIDQITWMPLWVSTCVHQALLDLSVDRSLIQIKWPNDLWIEQSKKISGVLCEKIGDNIIAGIGLNLAHAPLDGAGVVPSKYNLNVEQVLEKILFRLKSPKSVDQIKKYYEQYQLFQPGEKITWLNEVGSVANEAEVIGLGNAGELLVKLKNETKSLFSEEIQFLRSKK